MNAGDICNVVNRMNIMRKERRRGEMDEYMPFIAKKNNNLGKRKD